MLRRTLPSLLSGRGASSGAWLGLLRESVGAVGADELAALQRQLADPSPMTRLADAFAGQAPVDGAQ